MFLARYEDRLRRAQQMADWIDETLIDPETHLVFDGIKAGSLVRAQYTYCQGVVLGLETELAARTEDADHAERVHRLVAAIAEDMAPDGVIKGAGGGDGGLFNGILARYLALVVTTLPARGPEDEKARETARSLVLASAKAAWDNRQTVEGCRCSAPSGTARPNCHGGNARTRSSSRVPSTRSEIPERDLSVQLSGWMLMEAAHTSLRRTQRRRSDPGRVRPARFLACCPRGSAAAAKRDQDNRQHRGSTAADLHRRRASCGRIRPGHRAIGRCWTPTSGSRSVTHHFEMTVKHLVNDALMTFFFFIVGLEVTREFTIGELTDRSRAAVPVVAAIAGSRDARGASSWLFNPSGENAQAWGVVISTDTAFLVGALAIIKPKFPARLRIFLLTLAVVDDVGALVRDRVVLLRRRPGRSAAGRGGRSSSRSRWCGYLPAARGPAYAVLGVALWVALFIAGVHPTLAGVAVALLIPVFTPERRPGGAGRRAHPGLPAVAELASTPGPRRAACGESISINERLQTDVGPYVSFVILPLFALVNAGVRLDSESLARGAALTADVGHRRGPCGRKVRRHHRRDVVHAAHRASASWHRD